MNKIYLFGFVFGAFVVITLLVTLNVTRYDFSQLRAPMGLRPSPGVAALGTYTNDKYGFDIHYPVNLKPEASFKQFYVLSNNWRAYTEPESKGEGVVAIPVFRVDHGGVATGRPYPLYYSAEVRVGVSADPIDVKNCLASDPGFTNQEVATVTINGTMFKRFQLQDAAMMQYLKGASYRTVHNGVCFAVEQLAAGSSYRDDTMSTGLSQASLDSYYAQAGEIIKTFTFTK